MYFLHQLMANWLLPHKAYPGGNSLKLFVRGCAWTSLYLYFWHILPPTVSIFQIFLLKKPKWYFLGNYFQKFKKFWRFCLKWKHILIDIYVPKFLKRTPKGMQGYVYHHYGEYPQPIQTIDKMKYCFIIISKQIDRKVKDLHALIFLFVGFIHKVMPAYVTHR